MSKLFVIGIGGTGARVIKALTMLLASGVEINTQKVIPIIIDPDEANGDMARTIEILQNYVKVRNKLEFDNNRFFKTEIATLSSLEQMVTNNNEGAIPASFRFGISGTEAGTFGDFIKYDSLNASNKAFFDSLFTEDNRSSLLNVGFKGNPHIGAVVLNTFIDSNEFKFFANRLNDDDRVFIISSIFGGTGAAGFPLLVKNIREPKPTIPNPLRLRQVKLGAISVKPYFSVRADSTSRINSRSFITKTKTALGYYAKNLSGNNSLNALYYIGDTITREYDNVEGEKDQQNHAHLVELISALAIIDFCKIDNNDLAIKQVGKADNPRYEAEKPIYREYGIQRGHSEGTFNLLGARSQSWIKQPLTQYMYACYYWRKLLADGSFPAQPWVNEAKGAAFFKKEFLLDTFMATDLARFNARFVEWINEMGINERTFAPFETNVGHKLLHTVVNGVQQPLRGVPGFRSAAWDFKDYDGYVSGVAKNMNPLPPEAKLMALFYKATQAIYADRISTN